MNHQKALHLDCISGSENERRKLRLPIKSSQSVQAKGSVLPRKLINQLT